MTWLAVSFSVGSCTRPFAQQDLQPSPPRFVVYLHGRIVEDMGPDAVSPEYGKYDYAGILRHFADSGFVVVSELRSPDTDPEQYADSIVIRMRALIRSGVSPDRITIVGASKGAVIAMLVSSRMQESLRYVLIGNCNSYVFGRFDLRLHGHVLSIFEASDSLGQSCEPLRGRSPDMSSFEERRLQTGLRHGFLFRAVTPWLEPTVRWARR
jgi:hypothetical protein